MAPQAPATPTWGVEHLEDFTAHEWCNTLLSDPSISKIMKRTVPPPTNGPGISNSFFTRTLFNDDAIRAFLSLYRPGRGRGANLSDAGIAGDALLGDQSNTDNKNEEKEERGRKLDPKDDPDGPEALILVSLGKGVDGGIDRLHGGVTASLLDQVMGILVSYSLKAHSATAELTVKYKKPVVTPCVLLCRARVVKEAGRWVELVGWVEDGEGTVFAEGRGAFVKTKESLGDGNGNGNGGKVGSERWQGRLETKL